MSAEPLRYSISIAVQRMREGKSAVLVRDRADHSLTMHRTIAIEGPSILVQSNGHPNMDGAHCWIETDGPISD